jgi:hypothetical protein
MLLIYIVSLFHRSVRTVLPPCPPRLHHYSTPHLDNVTLLPARSDTVTIRPCHTATMRHYISYSIRLDPKFSVKAHFMGGQTCYCNVLSPTCLILFVTIRPTWQQNSTNAWLSWACVLTSDMVMYTQQNITDPCLGVGCSWRYPGLG